MKKNGKTIAKIVFIIIIILLLIYAVKDSLPQIVAEVLDTAWYTVALIVVATVVYHIIEGVITTNFARIYNPEFTLVNGIMCACCASFYRVATLGSGAGVAAVCFLNKHGIKAHDATGMYMIQYVLHKLSIAVFSGIFALINMRCIMRTFSKYTGVLSAGYALTAVVVVLLVALCVSTHFHRLCLWLLRKLDIKHKNAEKIQTVEEYFKNLKEATKAYEGRKFLLFKQLLINMVKLSCWYIIPYIILHDSGINVLNSLSVTSIATVLAGVLPTPAGIGSMEFVYTTLFTELTGTVNAASSVLLYRFATYVLPCILGGIVLLAYNSYRKRKVEL